MRALYQQKTKPVELTDSDFEKLIGACHKLAKLHQAARSECHVDDITRHHSKRISEFLSIASRLIMARNGKDWRYKQVAGVEDDTS